MHFLTSGMRVWGGGGCECERTCVCVFVSEANGVFRGHCHLFSCLSAAENDSCAAVCCYACRYAAMTEPALDSVSGHLWYVHLRPA